MNTLLVRFAAAVAALCSAGAATAQVLAPDQLFEKLAPSVWTVQVFGANNRALGLGSAVVIGKDSLVTNCHVLAKSSRVAIVRENVSYAATLEHPDPERDLCLLRVRNLDAPAVAIGDAETVRVGTRVYAIGSPRGLDQTLSDGLVSGSRRSERGELLALQISVPISPGSSGGGLFDGQGRLVGITTSGLRDSQNLNFAVPANWIAQVPERARALLAARTQGGGSVGGRRTGGPVYEYRLTDRITGNVSTVTYRLDRRDGDELIFNSGSRVEGPGGRVIRMTAPIGGEFDTAMPPGGWVGETPRPGSVWQLDYTNATGPAPVRMQLQARATGGETMLRLKSQELRVLEVEFTGYTYRNALAGALTNPNGRYTASAWYSPDLERIVRFDVRTRGGNGGAAFLVDEQLQLVDVREE
jgi:hypothetical protein